MALLMRCICGNCLWLPLVNTHEYHPATELKCCDVAHLLVQRTPIRHDAWQEVGLLDEHFFDSWKKPIGACAVDTAGWRIVYYPDLAVVHHGQHRARQQPVRNLPHFYRSYCHFYRKHRTSNLIGLPVLKTADSDECVLSHLLVVAKDICEPGIA